MWPTKYYQIFTITLILNFTKTVLKPCPLYEKHVDTPFVQIRAKLSEEIAFGPGRTNKQTDKQPDRWPNKQTDGQTAGQIESQILIQINPIAKLEFGTTEISHFIPQLKVPSSKLNAGEGKKFPVKVFVSQSFWGLKGTPKDP